MTFGIKNHTTIIVLLTMIPQLLKLLSPKRKSSNSQCCNSSQLDNPNHLCFRPSNPSLCHHNFYPHNSFKPHHCNRHKVHSLPPQKLSLRLLRRNAHQKCKNDASRPFRKMTTGSRRPKIEAEDVSPTQGASGGSLPQTMEQLG